MARRRFLHPDFFHDEALVTMPPFTRLLFAGLWCLADREGRLWDKPVKIKMQLFPADAVDVDAALTDLAAAGMVTRYTVDGRNYLQVNRFTHYQHPHPNEARSDIPAPPDANGTRADDIGTRAETHFAGYSGSSDTQDLRIPVAPDGPPAVAVRPAPVKPLTKPLAYKPRIDVAWPGHPPVPSALHAEFVQKLGGDPEDARRKLLAWYPVAALPYEDQPIGDDDWRFWRLRFREWVGTTAKPASATGPPRASDADILADIHAQKALRARR